MYEIFQEHLRKFPKFWHKFVWRTLISSLLFTPSLIPKWFCVHLFWLFHFISSYPESMQLSILNHLLDFGPQFQEEPQATLTSPVWRSSVHRQPPPSSTVSCPGGSLPGVQTTSHNAKKQRFYFESLEHNQAPHLIQKPPSWGNPVQPVCDFVLSIMVQLSCL